MKKFSCNPIFLTLSLLFLPQISRTQDVRSVALSQYTQNEGLSSYFITKILQDSYGFMWIGTQEGVNLFDGKHFQAFTSQSPPSHRLGGSFVSDMREDRKRSLLWVLTAYGDVCGIDLNTRAIRQRITLGPDGELLANHWLRCLQLSDSILWMGGHNILLGFNINKNEFLTFDLKTKSGIGSGEYNISEILFDRQERMWLGSEGYGIVVLDKHLNKVISFTDKLRCGQRQNRKLLFMDMIIDRDTIYAATSWGLRRFTAGKQVSFLPDGLHEIPANSEVQSLTMGPANVLLFSTPERFYSYDRGTQRLYIYEDEDKETDALASTFQLFYDSTSQIVWAGTQTGLSTFSLTKKPFNAFSKSSNSRVKMKHLYSILPASPQTAYGGDENGIYYIDLQTKEILCIDSASANYLLFRDSRSNIFVSNKNGFHVILHKKVVPAHRVFPALKDLANDHLSSAVQYNDSLILFASIIQKGLSVWNTRTERVVTYHQDSTAHRIEGLSIINYLYKSAGGSVFILTEKTVIEFHPTSGRYKIHTLKPNGSKPILNNFMDMCETKDRYWIATYGNGLVETDKRFNIKNILTVNSGLSNNCVYRVFADDSLILATTNNGLSVVDHRGKVKSYFETDGLHGNGFEQLCGYTNEGKIYAGGLQGFTVIEPSYLTTNTRPPKLFFHRIRTESASGNIDTTDLNMSAFVVPADAIQTTVHFSGLNYNNPDRITYAYKIDELGDQWISLSQQNYISLIGFSPGTYSLQVKAFNEDGVESKSPLKLSLVFLPKWYQTLWFKIIVMLLVIAFVFTLYQYRISAIQKQQRMRKEIANDLHDDIGSALNGLKIFTHLAQKAPDNKKHLDQMEELISSATLGLRDMIWVLDDSEDTVFELMERIKKFASPICLANGIHFVCHLETENSSSISKTEKRNLLLIAKEGLNNSIKYAACQKIQLTLSHDREAVKLVMEDDGVGFNKDTIVLGKGISNMQYRAKQIGYSISINSNPLHGTKIVLQR